MKLNNDLIRNMLLKIESEVDGIVSYEITSFCEVEFPGVPVDEAVYHMKYLLDANFVQGKSGYFRDITPDGRNFLNNVRDDKVWAETKKTAAKVGGVAINVLSEIAASVIKKTFGLP